MAFLLVLVGVVGTMLKDAIERRDPSMSWRTPAVSTTTPPRPTTTSGWWKAQATAPAWPSAVPASTPGGGTPTAGVLLPTDWPTMPQPTWLLATDTPRP